LLSGEFGKLSWCSLAVLYGEMDGIDSGESLMLWNLVTVLL
jgi:hypothetical protein